MLLKFYIIVFKLWYLWRKFCWKFQQEAVQKLTLLSRHSCLSEVRHYKSSVADDDVKNEHLRRTMLVREVMRIVQILEHKVNTAPKLST